MGFNAVKSVYAANRNHMQRQHHDESRRKFGGRLLIFVKGSRDEAGGGDAETGLCFTGFGLRQECGKF
jgi:hypothetical protein